MKHAERIQVVRAAIALADTVSSVGSTPLPQLTLSDLGEPAAVARSVRSALFNLLRSLETEPYLRGEMPVIASRRGQGFGLIPDDGDYDGPFIVDPVFATEAEANDYARSHGMKRIEPEREEINQHDAACICPDCADTPGAGHSPDRAEVAR